MPWGVDGRKAVVFAPEVVELGGPGREKDPFFHDLDFGTDLEHVAGRRVVGVLDIDVLQHIFDHVAHARFHGALVDGTREDEVGAEQKSARA